MAGDTITLEDFNGWMESIFNQPKKFIRVRDAMGHEYMADAGKIAPIPSENIPRVMADPKLREMVAYPV